MLLAAISGTPEGARNPLPDAALRVERDIRAMLPESVLVRVVDRINAIGEFDPYGVFDPSYPTIDPLTHVETLSKAVLILARGSRGDMLAIGRHEVIHALRELQLFDEPEWRFLVDQANCHKIGSRHFGGCT